MRLARMWNSKSPGVETAWRSPARISRNGCSFAGRGAPKRRSHAPDPNPMTQERPPSKSRNSTARNSAARSPQNERRVERFSMPGLSVATRKIAARVSGAATACARAGHLPGASGVLVVGSGCIGVVPENTTVTPLTTGLNNFAFYPTRNHGRQRSDLGNSLDVSEQACLHFAAFFYIYIYIYIYICFFSSWLARQDTRFSAYNAVPMPVPAT